MKSKKDQVVINKTDTNYIFDFRLKLNNNKVNIAKNGYIVLNLYNKCLRLYLFKYDRFVCLRFYHI